MSHTQNEKFLFNLSLKNFQEVETDDNELITALKQLGKFSFIPNPGNLGDCLIAKSTFDFFEKHKLPYHIWNGKQVDNLVYGGGGVWIKDYYSGAYLNVLGAMLLAKKVIILPSSIFECHHLIRIMDSRFTVFCREKQTYDYLLQQNTGAKIYLDHDMAFRLRAATLPGNFIMNEKRLSILEKVASSIKKINDTARFFREDIEKKNNFKSDFDISGILPYNIMNKDFVNFSSALMLSAVDAFNVILTDRLHVGIASALMGKQVYLFDNSYGKISGVYKQSLMKKTNVKFCTDIPELFNSNETKTFNFINFLTCARRFILPHDVTEKANYPK